MRPVRMKQLPVMLCLGKIAEEGQQDAFLCVVDATNLKLHLGLVLEMIELGRPIY